MNYSTTMSISVALLIMSTGVSAQSQSPALFVANNGNCEGSVSSLTIDADGALNFVQEVETGSVPCGSGQTAPGLNPQAIAISPNGRWLATGHGTVSGTVEQLTFFEVFADATFSILFTATTPDSPVDVLWLNDEYLAVTATPVGNDFVIIYKFDPIARTIVQHYYQPVPSIFDMVFDEKHDLLYTRAGTSGVQPFRVNSDYTITKLTSAPVATGLFFLGPGLSPDGTKLYFGGGISGDDQIGGMSIDTNTGQLTAMVNSPYPSGGNSPKQVVVSGENQHAFASHGTDATIRGYSIDQKTGELTPTTAFFDIGDQGDSGNMIVMGQLLFATDRYTSLASPFRGVYSFTIGIDGSLNQNGPLVDTQGISPWDIAVWPGITLPCAADITGDQSIDVDDLLAVINAWGNCPKPSCPSDIDSTGTVDVDDLLAVINAWGDC